MAGLLRPRPRRVVRPAPAVLMVEGVAQRVEGLLPAGRRDVEALVRLQVAPGREDVHVNAAAVLAVQDRRPRVAVRLQPGPRRLLELVEDGVDLRVGRPVPPAPTRSRSSGTCARTPASRRRRPPCPGLPGTPRRPRAHAPSRRDRRRVAVGPAGELVQVAADARELVIFDLVSGSGSSSADPFST